jgi:hypothetical protein
MDSSFRKHTDMSTVVNTDLESDEFILKYYMHLSLGINFPIKPSKVIWIWRRATCEL